MNGHRHNVALRPLACAAVLLASGLCMVQCSASVSGSVAIGVAPDGTPRWVRQGSGAFEEAQGRVFYGVGIATGITNQALLRQTADNRARGEVAKIFDTYIAAMMTDYQRSTTAGAMKASAEEQDIVSAQKTITEVTLRGVTVDDHWVDPQNGAVYALAALHLDEMNRSLEQAAGLNQRVRDYVRENARRAFEDLDRELRARKEPAAPAPTPAAAPAPAPAAPAPVAAKPAPQPAPAPAPAAPAVPVAAPTRPHGGKVRVGLKITGSQATTIQTCFANRLIAAGYALYENTSDVDVMVRGTLIYQKAGRIEGSEMVNATAEVRVTDTETNRTNSAVTETIKVGRPTLSVALQTAIAQLCERIVPKMVEQIRSGLTR